MGRFDSESRHFMDTRELMVIYRHSFAPCSAAILVKLLAIFRSGGAAGRCHGIGLIGYIWEN
jgi:hypothetical protein